MRKYRFLMVFLIMGVLIIPFNVFAAVKIKITSVVPKIVRQSDVNKIITIKGQGFKEGAEVSLGEGITVDNVIVKNKGKLIKAYVTVDLEAKIGKRTIVVTNPNSKKGLKKNALSVKECIKDCVAPEPFSGNPIPIHDKNSSQYRTDCTNASCHKGILKETSLNSSIDTFHVLKILKLSIIPGKTNDAKCLYCHKNTDIVERSAGSLRKNVDVAICYPCHAPGSIGKEFYKE